MMEARVTEPRMTHVHMVLLMARECRIAEYTSSLHSGCSLNLVSRSRAPRKLDTATWAELLLTRRMSEQANLENVSARSAVSRGEERPRDVTHRSGGRPLGGSSPPRLTW